MIDNKVKSKLKNIFVLVLTAIIAIAAAFAFYCFVETIKCEKFRKDYLSVNKTSVEKLFNIDSKLHYDMQVDTKFENLCLGNNNVSSLSYGNYCEKDGLLCKSTENTTLVSDNRERTINENPSSYINIINDCIYYRNDADRKLYKYDIQSEKTECVVDLQCSEVIVSVKGISYIDFNNSQLHYKSFDGKETIISKDMKVEKFALIGNSYLCLTKSKTLGWLTNGKFNVIEENVDRFLYNGNLLIQKNNNIFIYSNKKYKKTRVQNVNGVLIGLNQDVFYVFENSKIVTYNIKNNNTASTFIELNENEIPKSVFFDDKKIVLFIYDKNLGMYELKKYNYSVLNNYYNQ